MIKISSVRHSYPEGANFCIDRPFGHKEHTFLHFHSSIKIRQGNSLIIAPPHSVIVYTPNMPQFFQSDGGIIHDWLHFNCHPSDNFLPCALEPNKIYYPSDFEFITKTVEELETEFFSQKENYELLSDLKVRELFIKIARNINGNTSVKIDSKTEEKIRFLREKIFSNLAENWSVSKMAEQIHISQSRFFCIYKTVCGISPTADLINAKINSAKNMLIFTNKKISKIAEDLGYQNTTHFIRQFNKFVKVSPAKYRKQQKK